MPIENRVDFFVECAEGYGVFGDGRTRTDSHTLEPNSMGIASDGRIPRSKSPYGRDWAIPQPAPSWCNLSEALEITQRQRLWVLAAEVFRKFSSS